MPPEQFHLPDDYWVRIVYDCALGQRLRVISRDHLLRSMTPIYLAWVASYVNKVQNMGGAAVQERHGAAVHRLRATEELPGFKVEMAGPQ